MHIPRLCVKYMHENIIDLNQNFYCKVASIKSCSQIFTINPYFFGIIVQKVDFKLKNLKKFPLLVLKKSIF